MSNVYTPFPKTADVDSENYQRLHFVYSILLYITKYIIVYFEKCM